MQETFQDFICRDSFAKLSLDALIQVVQSESLNVQTEDQVVLAISQWTGSLKHTDGTERLPDLLREVRWNAVSNEAWQRIAGDENVIKLFPHFRWKQLPSSQTARRGAAMVSLEDGRVLLLGGDTGDTILTLVECATLPTDDWRANTAGTYNPFWRRFTPMHEARMAASACVLNGRIFVAGGVSRHNEILQSVEYFVPPKDEKAIGFWTVVQWMNQKRDTFTLLALENRLYAFGPPDSQATNLTFKLRDAAVLCQEGYSLLICSRKPVRIVLVCVKAYRRVF
ncbi:unnamed protein product [Schistocephalus solidus]|uniref:BACK domain-containing protein n=1 Tax=Schistocephalus solidus TaxID=70667 RepID=A0A183SVH4_SCHSO|nr:unnamed protein product [Schistocephalus solidus]